MKVLAFAASSSIQSINKQLALYAAGFLEGAEVETLDLNDFEMPIYSSDRETNDGIPEQAKAFYNKIGEADAIIVSLAEHNGTYSSAYKNIFDWASRIDMKVYQDKPVVYLATSPGPRGAAFVLDFAKNTAPFFGVDLKGTLSIPSFFDNFDMEKQELRNPELLEALKTTVSALKA
ncbi:NADPH-dependent FMN reductase [Grimontia celer]|uniref:NADPH-dependent FMN reductase n=1 Tax=Grimontia celer TaxID=1796497 RepID=A0A128F605_9GAMM|nr:NAD(P)H-dependent oxidoreductase [Grimontia celer]CZF82229.1 NADPH-dependent FMN reductase [Grimontia celer]